MIKIKHFEIEDNPFSDYYTPQQFSELREEYNEDDIINFILGKIINDWKNGLKQKIKIINIQKEYIYSKFADNFSGWLIDIFYET